MPKLQETQSYHQQVNPQSYIGTVSGTGRIFSPDVIVTTELPHEVIVAAITAIPNTEVFYGQSGNRPMPHFEPLPKFQVPKLTEYLFIQAGIQHATSLAHILSELANYPSAKNRILSILEPYIKATEQLVFDMPPISSKKGIAKVTYRGTAEPEFSLE